MKDFKKRLSLILATLTLLSVTAVFAGCATANEDDDEDKKNPQQTTPGTEVESGEVDHRFDGVDYKDREFRIYTSAHQASSAMESSNYLIEGEDKMGVNMVSDAVYTRNARTESRLGVELEFTITKGNSTAFKDFCQTLSNSISVGEGTYDLIGCYLRSAGVLTLEHYLVDMLEAITSISKSLGGRTPFSSSTPSTTDSTSSRVILLPPLSIR